MSVELKIEEIKGKHYLLIKAKSEFIESAQMIEIDLEEFLDMAIRCSENKDGE